MQPRVQPAQQPRIAVAKKQVQSRKDQFWAAVALEFSNKFDFHEIGRIIEFGKYARGEMPLPRSEKAGHEYCEEYVPGLEAKPWHDERTVNMSWISELESRSSIIQAELAAVLTKDTLFSGDSAHQTAVMGEGWSALRLQRLGQWNEANMARFPKTAAILQEIGVPIAMRGCMFARQAPGTSVVRHSDGRNFILTAHLGLQIPKDSEKCWIEVAGDRRCWEAGKIGVIDTSFVHATANESDEERHVLILDFWHPDLTKCEQEALKILYDLRYEFDKEIIERKNK